MELLTLLCTFQPFSSHLFSIIMIIRKVSKYVVYKQLVDDSRSILTIYDPLELLTQRYVSPLY